MFQMPLVAVPALQVVTVLMLVTAHFACLALANTDALTETVICRRLSCQPAIALALNRLSVLKLAIATSAYQAHVNTNRPPWTTLLFQFATAPALHLSIVQTLATATFAYLASASTDVPTETAMLPTYFNERSS